MSVFKACLEHALVGRLPADECFSGSLFSDCEAALPQLEALSLDRPAWRAKVSLLT